MERNEITKKLRLQLITNGESLSEITAQVESFLKGGGRWVQLRMKDAPIEAIVEAGHAVCRLCREYGAVCIVNDRPEIALQVGADGVHIGRNDVSPVEARAILGPDRIVGCTANTFEDIERLNGYAIDYIGLGPFRFTETKKNLSPVLGAEGYGRIFSQLSEHGIRIPVVLIGGIRVEDIPVLNGVGGRYYAVSGAIGSAEKPEEMTGRFLAGILSAKN